MPTETVDAISSFIDSYNTAADEVKDDTAVESFLEKCKDAVPGLMSVLGELGQHAPLVGVAFSVLNFRGQEGGGDGGDDRGL